MDPIVITYFIYLALSLLLTVWVAHTLFKNGRRFLLDVFAEKEDLADSVNRLLLVGFYLVNLGYVSLALRIEEDIANTRESIEALSWKVGLVLVVLGGMHFGNIFIFQRMRERSKSPRVPAPSRAPGSPVAAQAALAAQSSMAGEGPADANS